MGDGLLGLGCMPSRLTFLINKSIRTYGLWCCHNCYILHKLYYNLHKQPRFLY